MNSRHISGNTSGHQTRHTLRHAVLPLVLLCFAVPTIAADFHGVTYHNCHDGDSCTFTISEVHPLLGKRIKVEVSGIDAPELVGGCARELRMAKQARDLMRTLLKEAQNIDLINARRGKEFHLDAKVLVDEKNVAEILIGRQLAARYNGGTSPADWCFKRRSFGLEIPYPSPQE